MIHSRIDLPSSPISRRPAVLYLQDGSRYEGFSIGAAGTTFGEICFNTGMTGYQEVFTDPSYHGQILVATGVHIGNYGVDEIESESDCIRISGLVCRNFADIFSRSKAGSGENISLQAFFEKYNVNGISGVDTRAIVNRIRNSGAMNAVISNEIFSDTELAALLSQNCPNMSGLELASTVSTKEAYLAHQKYHYLTGENLTYLTKNFSPAQFEKRYKVAVVDFGVKINILASLIARNCEVKVFPAKATFEEIMAYEPAGVLLSNGPGDPEPMDYAIDLAKKLLDANISIFGICLGHQVLALASGLKTFKMPFGHRGLNHPVINLKTNRSEITSQNHGFTIERDSLINHPNVVLTHVNLNDHSVEGIEIKDKQAFSVQYHPESNPGPHDSRYLFDQFVSTFK